MALSMFSELPADFEIKHPHDLLSRRILFDVELFASLLENYECGGDTSIIKLLDLSSLQCESPVTVDSKLREVRGDLRFSTKFKDGGYSNVFLFFEHQSTCIRLFSLSSLRKILEFYEG
ncbi:MAG: Rpn family recombination-promoting nuclease/putative transposase, partial [Planctomycetaceae bacterium]|nr:Rpn family recombination-promoting nuclease/putative transposase [Planctomycetaceae bacterium]